MKLRICFAALIVLVLLAAFPVGVVSSPDAGESQLLTLGPAVDVSFRAHVDGTLQRYVQRLPVNFDATKEHYLLIALHGHGSDRWQYALKDGGELRGARDMAAKYEMIFISPDYRAATSWMGPKAEADVIQIIQDMRRRYKIRKVFLAGASMGGSSVLTFTALHPNMVDGVISQNGTANHLEYSGFQDAISKSFGGTKEQIPTEYKKRSAEYWPEKFVMPVAITTSGQDTVVPPQSAIRLAGILKQLGRKVLLIHREQMWHTTSYEDTVAALEFVIKASLE